MMAADTPVRKGRMNARHPPYTEVRDLGLDAGYYRSFLR